MLDFLVEVSEQCLHMLWAFGALATFWAINGRTRWSYRAVAAGAVFGLLLALPREVVDQWPIERPLDTVIDLVFFALGGACAGVLGWRIDSDD